MSGFDLDKAIRRVPDFPKPGILFYDITSIFTQPEAFSFCIEAMCERYKGMNIDAIAGVESRGFLFAAPLAERLHLPLLLIRKKGKLPGEKYTCSYSLEYGTATIEAHKADIHQGKRYLVVDDLIATGGTLRAAQSLIEQGGGTVSEFFAIIGLSEFPYAKGLSPIPVTTLIQY
ncbi:MAG: adenine phosphoribosyltransferase [Spirochaetaceae bacterium]|nr:adenine phosphoribosyltransferase [Spirochaetaceae bacterium]